MTRTPPGAGPSSTPGFLRRRRTALTALALALAAAAPYLAGGGLREFVLFDDDVYVSDNPAVRAGLSLEGFRWAFTTLRDGNWHPLTWLAHMAAVSLFGLDARWHHLLNVALHAAATALLFVALRRLTGAAGRSALVAALFGVHPLHVESVAWIAELKDLLAGGFFAAVLLAYERYARRGGAGRYLLVAALLALGLLAKATLVTVPVVLLLCDAWPLGRLRWPPRGAGGIPRGIPPWSRVLAEKVPLLALAAAASAATVVAGRAGGAVSTLAELPLWPRLANALVTHAAYLGKTVWPVGLAAYYPHPGAYPAWQAAAGAALVALIAAAGLLLSRRRPYLLAGWAWFVVMLAPVSGVVQAGAQAMADRYTYLPLIGVFVALSWGGAEAVGATRRPGVALALSAALVAALGARAADQAGTWRDTGTLFTHALAVTRDNWFAHNNLGVYQEARGRHAEAERHLREALRINPLLADARGTLGSMLLRTGRAEEAEQALREAARGGGGAGVHYNLGVVLAARGAGEEAAAEYREALRRQPDHYMAHANLANTLLALGRPGDAEPHYREAVRLRPDLPEGHYNLANLLADRGRTGEAVAGYRRALELRPGYLDARYNLALVLEGAGRLEEAAEQLRLARDLDPADPEIPYRLGVVLARSGRSAAAAEQFRRALALEPAHDRAREGLGLVSGERRPGPRPARAPVAEPLDRRGPAQNTSP